MLHRLGYAARIYRMTVFRWPWEWLLGFTIKLFEDYNQNSGD